jgi:hypothetical protein
MSLLEALQTLLDNGLPEEQVVGVAEELLEQGGLDDDDDIKPLLLVAEFGTCYLDAVPVGYDDCVFEANGQEWLVCDDDERESRWDDCLESYLDDGCVEGADSPYFNREAWKRDARMDGAGHALSPYDGNEYECTIGGNWYYIYRLN